MLKTVTIVFLNYETLQLNFGFFAIKRLNEHLKTKKYTFLEQVRRASKILQNALLRFLKCFLVTTETEILKVWTLKMLTMLMMLMIW